MNCPGGQIKILKWSYLHGMSLQINFFSVASEIWSYHLDWQMISGPKSDSNNLEYPRQWCKKKKKQVQVHTSCVFFSNIALCTFASCSRTSSFACSACRCASHSAFRLCIIKSICHINSINSDSQLLNSVPPKLHLKNHLEMRPFARKLSAYDMRTSYKKVIPPNLLLNFSLQRWKQIITDRIRSTGEGNVFTRVCLSTGVCLLRGVCMEGALHGGETPLPTEIRSTGGRYASYRNAFLLNNMFDFFLFTLNQSTTSHCNATYPPDRFRSAHRPVNGGSIPFIYT